MRYFVKTDILANDVDRIAGEIINISLGRNYFINGRINPMPDVKANYNTYDIDSVAYEIHPNIGVVFILGDDLTRNQMYTAIKQSTADLERQLYATHGFKKPSTGTAGTTQYLLIEDPSSVGLAHIEFLPSAIMYDVSAVSGQSCVSWCISQTEAFSLLPRYDKRLRTVGDLRNPLYSLSSIIYDPSGAFQLPDGYLSPDYPDICDTVSYKKDLIIKNRINVGVTCGLYLEIAKLFGVVRQKKPGSRGNRDITEFVYSPFPPNRVLNWIKWADVKPLGTEISVLSTMELIKRGLLDFDESRMDESDERVNSAGVSDYRCFITGVPIYEDAYVFDVYQQVLEDVIDINDCSKYPGAEIIPIVTTCEIDVENKVEESKIVLTSDTDLRFAGLTDDDVNELKDAAERRGFRDMDHYLDRRSGVLHIARLRKATAVKLRKELKRKPGRNDKKDSVLDGKKDSVLDGKKDSLLNGKKDSVLDGEPIVLVKKMPLKRGQKKPIELVKIRRTINYETSRHLLVSPFYMHCMDIKDAVSAFEKNTSTKVLVFRTFSPRTLKSVINSIPDLQRAHRQFLHEFNQEAVKKSNTFETKNTVLCNEFTTEMILKAHIADKIIGEWEYCKV